MTPEQQAMVIRLATKEISQSEFLSAYDIDIPQIPDEISRSLKMALDTRDADAVVCSFLLAFVFSMPADILDTLQELVIQDWHFQHEEIIGRLQQDAEESSVPFIEQAIELKPSLKYLNFDDFGAYYKKCFYVLEKIGTPEAIAVVEKCAVSLEEDLSVEAMRCLRSIRGEAG